MDNFCDCGNAGNSPIPCHDSRNDEFPIDSELVIPMYSMTLEFLRTAFITPTDEENDTTNSRLSGQQS